MYSETHDRVEDLPFSFPVKEENTNNNDSDKENDGKEEPEEQTQGLSCEICKIKVTSIKIFQRHLDGRKHKLRANRQGKEFKCELCGIIANSEIQLEIHLRSGRHKAKLLEKENPRWITIKFVKYKTSLLMFVTFICILLNLFLLLKTYL